MREKRRRRNIMEVFANSVLLLFFFPSILSFHVCMVSERVFCFEVLPLFACSGDAHPIIGFDDHREIQSTLCQCNTAHTVSADPREARDREKMERGKEGDRMQISSISFSFASFSLPLHSHSLPCHLNLVQTKQKRREKDPVAGEEGKDLFLLPPSSPSHGSNMGERRERVTS